MQENTEKDFDFSLNGLLKFIFQYKQALLIVTVAAFVFSAVVSFLIPPQYKSTSIVFPSASTSVSHSLLGVNLPKKELLTLGKEEEVEQMLQVLQSDEIKKKIVHKYNLMSHYGISGSSYPQTRLDEEYKDNIKFTRTPYFSIEIEVFDKDPQIAANIANDITSLVDTTINNMLKERAMKALALVEREYVSLKEHKQMLEDSLKRIQSKGVYHYEYQSQALNEALGKALAEGKTKGVEEVEKKLKILAEYGGAYVSIRDLLERETEKLSILESKYSEAKVDADQDLPHTFVISRAVKAEKKSYPIEWLIITLSTISAFIMGLFLLIILDRLKKKNLEKS